MNASEFQALKQAIIDDVRVMMQTTGQVTQYIGARYVPLIADPIDWSDQKEYEPLTIVTYQGNSYTSRQFVPKGTPITNQQFWASTGNFNAQIEQYRQEVAKFDTRITSAQNSADSKAPANHASESTEYGIGNEMQYGHVKLSDDSMIGDANSGTAATPKLVNDAIVKASKRVFGFIGDSFAEATPGRVDWVNGILQELLGNDPIYNKAYSGAGFVGADSAASHQFIDQLNALANEHPEITDIIIYGGNNDKSHLYEESLNTACTLFASTLNTRFPHRNVHLFLENFNTNDQQQCWFYTQKVIFAFNTLKASNTLNISLYNGTDEWMFNSQLTRSTTDTHPNDAMRQYMGIAFAAIINGSTPNMAFNHKIKYEPQITTSGITEITFDNGCIIGAEISFKTSSKSASQDVFKWETPLTLFKSFTIPGIYENKFPCSLWIGKEKATLYMASENASTVNSNGVFYFALPNLKIRP